MLTFLFFETFLISGIAGKVQGVVKDEDTDKPVAYADVIILDSEIGTATGENGDFYILNVPAGRYTIEVSCIGYQTKRIQDVIVEVDRVARLSIDLKQTAIEIEPITVINVRPVVSKDMTGTTYIIKKAEITTLPVDYFGGLIALQPSVVRLDTTLHVRGGRATEVLYMIDNVAIIDPLTGEPAINISKGVADEIIFLPGGFDVEYGRAMSGVVNVITERPSDRFAIKAYGKTERMMPFYYDFGYENYQTSFHLPLSKRLKGFFSFDALHTDDWNPKLYILPHKQRDDYALFGKWVYAPSGKIQMSLCGAQSRTQYEKYYGLGYMKWIFYPERFRSDFNKGNLQAFNLNYLPDSRKFINVTLSRLYTKNTYGLKEYKNYGLFEDYKFKDYRDLVFHFASGSINNPFGVRRAYFPYDGDYPEYRNRSSLVMKANINSVIQIHKYHEVKAGFEYAGHNFQNFSYWVSNDPTNPITDEWQYSPVEYSLYLQDNIDYKGLYSKLGCRYDYFSSMIEGISPKAILSPRVGFSVMMTERFIFRTNVGTYTQPPLYDYMDSYYLHIPYPEWVWYSLPVPIGNPNLGPEKTTSYEMGFQGQMRKNLSITFNAFYKDIKDLVGTRYFIYQSHLYFSYFNVEFGNAKGIETILEYSNPVFNGKVSYTLSWAQGTSSYASEVLQRYWYDSTYVPQSREYYLDFDQRHRIFIQGQTELPLQTKLYLFVYLGTGFPYTPPGYEGKTWERNALRLSFQKQIDFLITKSFRVGKISLSGFVEVNNLLDIRYQIRPYTPYLGLVTAEECKDYISLLAPYYHPAVDINHDGLITPKEEFLAQWSMARYVNEEYWVDCYTAPRRTRLGISINL